MNHNQRGFTLIELMIVVAIIGILASLAIPAYQSYLIRAQIAEGLTLSGPLQNAVAVYFNDNGVFPTDNAEATAETADSYGGKYVSTISINNAVISIQYGNDANALIIGQTVTMTAVNNDGSLSWNCASGGAISNNYLPASCR